MKKAILKYSTFVLLFFFLFATSTYAFACGLCADTYTHSFLHTSPAASSSGVELWSSESRHPPVCNCASHKEGVTYSKRLQRDDLLDLALLPDNSLTLGLEIVEQDKTVSAPDTPIFTTQTQKIHRTVVLLN
jgi:hypothetical protein